MRLKIFHKDSFGKESAPKAVLGELKSYLARCDESVIAAMCFFDVDAAAQEDLEKIKKALGKDVPLIGCSSDGEFSSIRGFEEDSFLLALFTDKDQSNVHCLKVEGVSSLDEAEIEEKINKQIASMGFTPSVNFCFSESLLGSSGDTIANAIRKSFPPECLLLGGMSADQWSFQKTYQCFEGELLTDALVLLSFEQNFCREISIANGFKEIESFAKYIVRSDGKNKVFSIGDKTAVDFYGHYLGSVQGSFGEYPIKVYVDEAEPFFRAPFNWDHESGSIEFGGYVPDGAFVQLAQTTGQDLLSSTESCLQDMDFFDSDTNGLVAVLCAARKHLLGAMAEKEVQILKDTVPEGIPFLGFYGFGEYLWTGDNRSLKSCEIENVSTKPMAPAFLHETSIFLRM